MKFIILPEDHKAKNASLTYSKEWGSFGTEPLSALDVGGSSILINDLQLEIDDEGKILYVWGYCPLIRYEKTNETPEHYICHGLQVILDKEIIPGISTRLNEGNPWPRYINPKTGWVCIGNPVTQHTSMIEFAPDSIATMQGDQIIAVWLHPKWEP